MTGLQTMYRILLSDYCISYTDQATRINQSNLFTGVLAALRSRMSLDHVDGQYIKPAVLAFLPTLFEYHQIPHTCLSQKPFI